MPELPANEGLSPDQFISMERAIGTLPENAHLISAELVPFNVVQDEKEISLPDVSPDRMVWVVKVAHPNGIKTRRGFYANATQIKVYDAQTGAVIITTITGELDISSLRTPWSRRKLLAPQPGTAENL